MWLGCEDDVSEMSNPLSDGMLTRSPSFLPAPRLLPSPSLSVRTHKTKSKLHMTLLYLVALVHSWDTTHCYSTNRCNTLPKSGRQHRKIAEFCRWRTKSESYSKERDLHKQVESSACICLLAFVLGNVVSFKRTSLMRNIGPTSLRSSKALHVEQFRCIKFHFADVSTSNSLRWDSWRAMLRRRISRQSLCGKLLRDSCCNQAAQGRRGDGDELAYRQVDIHAPTVDREGNRPFEACPWSATCIGCCLINQVENQRWHSHWELFCLQWQEGSNR